jgi:hypothetical protein
MGSESSGSASDGGARGGAVTAPAVMAMFRERFGIPMPPGYDVGEIARDLSAFAAATGESSGEAVLAKAADAWAAEVGTWSEPKPTPQLFRKHWASIQARMTGVVSIARGGRAPSVMDDESRNKGRKLF